MKRSALDASRKIKLARAERFAAYDSKRRGLQEELEERERAFKKARVEKAKAEQAMQEEVERLGEEGRRRRKEKEETMARKTEEEQKSQQKASAPGALGEPTIGPHDTTVRLKYKLATYPTLTTAPALASHLAVFGTVDTGAIVISLKANKKQPEKPPKFATALVPFEKAGDAYACLCSAGKAGRGLEGVEVTWVTEDEPEIIKWLRTQGKPGASINASGDTDGPFASFPSNSVSLSIPLYLPLRTNLLHPVIRRGSANGLHASWLRFRIRYAHANASTGARATRARNLGTRSRRRMNIST